MLTFTQKDLLRAEEEARRQQEEATKQQEVARLAEERVKVIRLAVEGLSQIEKQMKEIGASPAKFTEAVPDKASVTATKNGTSLLDDDDEFISRPRIRIINPTKPKRKPSTATTVVAEVVDSKRGRGRGRPKLVDIGGVKQPFLADVIMSIVQRHKHGLALDELLIKVRQTNYRSTSGNFRNMVQQAVNRLMNQGKLIKDDVTMKYKAV